MFVSELIKDLENVTVMGNDLEIEHLTYSTSDIQKQSMFFCVKGLKTDGHELAALAVSLGAAAIVLSKQVEIAGNCTRILVRDTKEAMAMIAASFHGHPEKQLKLYGFTGTNGKTTSTYLLRSILEKSEIRAGLLGTICNASGTVVREAERTTMEALELQQEFDNMRQQGCDACVMEVSSHSLALKRVYSLYFKVGIFTNLSQDHLDFHDTMEQYYEAKRSMFNQCECAVVNVDDEYGRRLIAELENRIPVLRYGIKQPQFCDVFADRISIDSSGSSFRLNMHGESIPIHLKLPGSFNIYNALGAASAAIATGIRLSGVKMGLDAVKVVPGRSESIESGNGFQIIIDYAHTPDGIYNILTTVREYTMGRILIVFGCGGDRDKLKRPEMGRIAGEHADFCILTSDNPRSEEPEAILQQILPGILQSGCPYEIIADRREAIAFSLHIAREGDVIVIAGKGHEPYQILKDRTIRFDEREIVGELLREGDH